MVLALMRSQWDRVAAWVATGAGALLLVVGYFKVSNTPFPAEQVPYLVSAGLGSLFLLGLAGTLWISADLRDEYAKLEEIALALAERSPDDAGAEEVSLPAQTRPVPAEEPSAAPARTRASRPSARAAARSAQGV